MSRYLNVCVKTIEITSFLAVIFGIIFGIIQYLDDKQARRVSASLEIVSKFQETHLSEARYQAFKIWRSPFAIGALSRGISVDDISMKIIELGKDDEASNLEQNLFLIVDYYEIVNQCATSAVCDFRSMSDQLGSYARAFYCSYKTGFIEKIRNSPNVYEFADGLENFVYHSVSYQLAVSLNQIDATTPINLRNPGYNLTKGDFCLRSITK